MELNSAIKFFNEGNYTQALVIFLALPESESREDKFKIAYYIGLCYARLSRSEDAIGYLEQVVTSDTNIARVYQCRLILAYVYATSGRTRLAEFELGKLKEAGYESAQVYTSMGYVFYEHGEVDKAIEAYSKALELNPKNPTAQNGLGYIYADTGKNLRQALVLCNRAHEAQPDNPAYLDSLAWVYHNLDYSKEAKQFITKAKESLPNNKIILDHYNKILGVAQ